MNLSELYTGIEVTNKELTDFTDALKNIGLNHSVTDGLVIACCKVADAYEMQGFINGFRIGMLLAEEIYCGGEKETNHAAD